MQHWLRGIIEKVLESRRSPGTLKELPSKPNDFLQWLIDGRQKSHEPIDVPTMVGHCGTFLLEGFETSSSLMAFALYEVWYTSLANTKHFTRNGVLNEVVTRYQFLYIYFILIFNESSCMYSYVNDFA